MSNHHAGEAEQPSLRLVAEHEDVVDAAVDILARRHQVSRDDAADLLYQAGDDGNRDLQEVAEDVVLIGLPTLSTPVQTQVRTRPVTPTDGSIAGRVLDMLADGDTVEEVLTGIAGLATEMIPHVDLASVTLIREGAPATVASSDEGARRIDETQYADGHGPCLHAARTDRLVHIDDVSDAAGFDAWRTTARRLGVTATASVPIPSTPNIAAALNLYRTDGTGWPQEDLDAAETLATYAGDALTVAYRHTQPPRR